MLTHTDIRHIYFDWYRVVFINYCVSELVYGERWELEARGGEQRTTCLLTSVADDAGKKNHAAGTLVMRN
jgi:hypothetical protein